MVVLDTHAWLWWVADRKRLSDAASEAIERSESIAVAAISVWEVAVLTLRDRIALDRELERWVREALAQPGVRAVAVTQRIALAAALLDREGFGPDPADRLIYATARDLGAPLVTRDSRIRDFDRRGTIW